MFDLSDRPLVWLPVKWKVLRPNPAKPEAVAVEKEALIEVEVELKDRDDLLALFDDTFGDHPADGEPVGVDVAGDGEKLTGRQLEAARFAAIVKRWRKVKANGNPLELNPENILKMLAVPGFASAFETTYLAACAGKADIRRGN